MQRTGRAWAHRRTQPAPEVGQAQAGGDADDDWPHGRRPAIGASAAFICCGLDREHEHVAGERRVVEGFDRTHAEALRERVARRLAEFDDLDAGGGEAALEHAADEGGGHVAAAEEGDLHGWTCVGWGGTRGRASGRRGRVGAVRARSPKIAGAHAHDARALGDRRLEVVRHAHRQGVERESRRRAAASWSPHQHGEGARSAASSALGSGMHMRPRRRRPRQGGDRVRERAGSRPAPRRSCCPRR